MSFSYPKKEKLKSKKLIEQLFSEGKSISTYPLRLVYLETTFDEEAIQFKTGVSVSKRHFKNAVDRNRIKRLLREAYRLNKAEYFNNILSSYALMILYIGKDGTDFDSIETKMKELLDAFSKKVSQQ
ncbi:ribonuclease P protein component [Psychroserpens luteolus]|uniref:ribonuclease P protein component n=1 Tax=Psychroserpens luteolus TaxID=2855840 RepID=UPI001E36C189|nr:ribonuclease P protein component [Psychroserpens luteolus]MCD2258288.1 ribonuclease P protein component [Psychroserpens luteolus]